MAAMDILKIAGLWGVLVAVTHASPLSCMVPAPPEGPPEGLIREARILDLRSPISHTAILVQVLEVERQERPTPPYLERPTPPYQEMPTHTYATMRVLKSWKGPVNAGAVLHTAKGDFFFGCQPWDFQSEDRGKEFLIMNPRVDMSGEVFVPIEGVWPAEKSQALMAALDQAVVDSMPTNKANYASRLQLLEKEWANIHDADNKLRAAESRHAPDEELVDLSNQLRWHEENASHLGSMLRTAAPSVSLALLAQAEVTVYGAGASSCSKWLTDRENPTYSVELSWLVGFFLTDNLANAIAASVDKYCRENPLKNIAEASRDLVVELSTPK